MTIQDFIKLRDELAVDLQPSLNIIGIDLDDWLIELWARREVEIIILATLERK